MANSTNIISDLRTVTQNAPTAASATAATNPNGPLTDIVGLVVVALAEAEGLKKKLQAIASASDAGDTNYFTTINNVVGTLGS